MRAKDNQVIIFPTAPEAEFFKRPHHIMNGIGKVYATMNCLELILCNPKIKRIVLMGTCAAFDNTPLFTPIISTSFIEYDMDCRALGHIRGETPFSNLKGQIVETKFNGKIKSAYTFRMATIASSDTFMTSKPEDMPANYIDMEAAAMAKTCREFNVEFISVKIVTDNANKDSKQDWEKNCETASKILNEIEIV